MSADEAISSMAASLSEQGVPSDVIRRAMREALHRRDDGPSAVGFLVLQRVTKGEDQ
jgi:hypothetical protein